MQLTSKQIRVSRMTLVEELGLGEGSVKTLVKHLKMHSLVETSKGGMRLSEKGKNLYSKLAAAIPHESPIPKCSVGLGKFNHAILLKGLGSGINSGIEQRDFAKVMGATGATTLLYENKKFLMPGQTQDSLKNERHVRRLMESLLPQNDDVIIITSAEDKKTAELAAKYAALMTVANHHRHF